MGQPVKKLSNACAWSFPCIFRQAQGERTRGLSTRGKVRNLPNEIFTFHWRLES